MARQWTTEMVSRLWTYLDLGNAYPWSIGPVGRERLQAIMPEISADFFDPPAEELNVSLREIVSPLLRTGERRLPLAIWIVKNWGGIGAISDDVIRDWMDSLQDFARQSVQKFVEANTTSRISSWSKLLAFADHKQYAVYDARTAVALNCAFAAEGMKLYFPMPNGRNDVIREAQGLLLRRHCNSSVVLGYDDYIGLLEAVAKQRLARSVIAAEMVIFSNAPEVARRFGEGNTARG